MKKANYEKPNIEINTFEISDITTAATSISFDILDLNGLGINEIEY